jgi:hypothetical protein
MGNTCYLIFNKGKVSMSDISKDGILNKLGLNEDQGRALLEAAAENPFEALTLLQTYNPDPAALQELMAQFMTNPKVFVKLAESLGFSPEKLADFKTKLGQ